MIREQGIIVFRKTLDSFQTRMMTLPTGQEAVIVGVGETRRGLPVGPYVKILCGRIINESFYNFDVRANEPPGDGEGSIIRCKLVLDKEGNVTGLSDDTLYGWLNHTGQNYLLEYKANPLRPDTADLVAVGREAPLEGIRYYKHVDQASLPFNPSSSGYPPSVDLIETLDMYLGGQNLTVAGILAKPLVPAAPSSL